MKGFGRSQNAGILGSALLETDDQEYDFDYDDDDDDAMEDGEGDVENQYYKAKGAYSRSLSFLSTTFSSCLSLSFVPSRSAPL